MSSVFSPKVKRATISLIVILAVIAVSVRIWSLFDNISHRKTERIDSSNEKDLFDGVQLCNDGTMRIVVQVKHPMKIAFQLRYNTRLTSRHDDLGGIHAITQEDINRSNNSRIVYDPPVIINPVSVNNVITVTVAGTALTTSDVEFEEVIDGRKQPVPGRDKPLGIARLVLPHRGEPCLRQYFFKDE